MFTYLLQYNNLHANTTYINERKRIMLEPEITITLHVVVNL